jgi:hypothetical protein
LGVQTTESLQLDGGKDRTNIDGGITQ